MHILRQVPLPEPKRVISAEIPADKFEDLTQLCLADNHSRAFMVKCGIAMAMIITKEQRQAVVEEFEGT
jgi:hypothetical protein